MIEQQSQLIEQLNARNVAMQATLAELATRQAERAVDAAVAAAGVSVPPQARAEAVDAISSAIKELAGRSDAAAKRIRDLLGRGDGIGAKAAFDDMLREKAAAGLPPDPADARLARDIAKLLEFKDVRTAAALYDKASELDDTDVWTFINLGDQHVAAGDLNAAMRAFERARALSEESKNERDLSVSHDRIGDVLVAQGRLPAALDAYRASLAIAERLAAADPGNAGWQRDLSVSHNKIGDVLVAQGSLPAALDAYRASLAIAERLAKADPGNAGWQHDVALSLQRVGIVAARQGQIAEARATYERGLVIMEKLVALAPTHAGFKRDLDWFTARLAELK
ncbi:MAG: tetratricopeptide repeat protein [Hyphomicrobiales bacterium]|nr:tetratricopeptide repeat protein [Hyphomicrobiales bacterium]